MQWALGLRVISSEGLQNRISRKLIWETKHTRVIQSYCCWAIVPPLVSTGVWGVTSKQHGVHSLFPLQVSLPFLLHSFLPLSPPLLLLLSFQHHHQSFLLCWVNRRPLLHHTPQLLQSAAERLVTLWLGDDTCHTHTVTGCRLQAVHLWELASCYRCLPLWSEVAPNNHTCYHGTGNKVHGWVTLTFPQCSLFPQSAQFLQRSQDVLHPLHVCLLFPHLTENRVCGQFQLPLLVQKQTQIWPFIFVFWYSSLIISLWLNKATVVHRSWCLNELYIPAWDDLCTAISL